MVCCGNVQKSKIVSKSGGVRLFVVNGLENRDLEKSMLSLDSSPVEGTLTKKPGGGGKEKLRDQGSEIKRRYWLIQCCSRRVSFFFFEALYEILDG